MPTDTFVTNSPGLTSPATKHFAITPNDSTDLDPVPRAIYVGTAGDLVVQDQAGTSCTYKNAAGVVPIRAKRVMVSSTASNLVGMY